MSPPHNRAFRSVGGALLEVIKVVIVALVSVASDVAIGETNRVEEVNSSCSPHLSHLLLRFILRRSVRLQQIVRLPQGRPYSFLHSAS